MKKPSLADPPSFEEPPTQIDLKEPFINMESLATYIPGLAATRFSRDLQQHQVDHESFWHKKSLLNTLGIEHSITWAI